MANLEHLARLEKSVTQQNHCQMWNAWRASHPEIEIDLSNSNLVDMNLYGANLANANLRRAKLARTDLRNTTLSGAWVYGLEARALLATDIICTHLIFGQRKGEKVLYFYEQTELVELENFLVTPNRDFMELYESRVNEKIVKETTKKKPPGSSVFH